MFGAYTAAMKNVVFGRLRPPTGWGYGETRFPQPPARERSPPHSFQI